MALYNDRAYAFDRMSNLDVTLDKEPTLDNVRRMVNDDERNHLAFQELEHFSVTGTFLYLHPILKHHKLTNDLDALRKASPERFMNEMVNADKNITRYRSQLKNQKYRDDKERQAWEGHIKVMAEKLDIMKRLIAK